MGSMLFLGLGLGVSLHKGGALLWTVGLLATVVLVFILLARWQVRPVTEPLGQLLGGTRPRSIKDLPLAWSALEQENIDLREKAAREDRLLPGIMARLEEGVLLFSPGGGLEHFNPAAQRHLGLGAPLAKGMGVGEVFRDADSAAAVERAYQGLGAEWRLLRSGRTLRVRGIPFAPLGAITGVLLTLDDISNQEALETTRQKFISNVSHELKTPVTAIRIAAENLLEERLPDPAKGSTQSILRSVDRLTLLLGDLSELSRIESGALKLSPEAVDLGPFLSGLLEELRRQHANKGVGLAALAADCMPITFSAAGWVGVAHVGRVGFAKGIAGKTVTKMRELGAADIRATIGPSICGKCYEVAPDMYQEIGELFPATRTSDALHSLDLQSGVTYELETMGVSVRNLNVCTLENPHYFSFRGGDLGARQVGLISL